MRLYTQLPPMTEQELAALTDEELLAKQKKQKSINLMAALLIGFIGGIAVYSAVRNGFGWVSLVAFLAIPIARSNRQENDLLQKELKARNLA